MNKVIFNSIILNNTQIMYLTKGTAGIDRMKCLFQLVQIVIGRIESSSDLNETYPFLWQADISEISLAKLWKCDRKTVSKMLDTMGKLGILSSVQTRRGSVHTLLCISAWIVDGKKFVNPHYVPINQRTVSNSVVIGTSTRGTGDETTAVDTLERTTSDDGNFHNDGTDKYEKDSRNTNSNDSQAIPPCVSSSFSDTEDDTYFPKPTLSDMVVEEKARQLFAEDCMEQGCSDSETITVCKPVSPNLTNFPLYDTGNTGIPESERQET